MIAERVREIELKRGEHRSPQEGMCFMEAVAWIAGEPHSDHPECVSPVLGAFLRSWNDALDDETRQKLNQYKVRVIGTANDGHDEWRAWLAVDWLARTQLPVWLDLARLGEHAAAVRALIAISTPESATVAQPTLDAARDAARVFAQIDDRLANDNATGRIFVQDSEGAAEAELLSFPGRDRPRAQSYGPFTQEGSLDGVLISVGGKDETVPLRLQNGDVVHANCETTRAIARELGRHLFEPIRVHGSGRWMREGDGTWTMKGFRVHRFDVLGTESLRESVAALRAVRGSGWKDMGSPLSELEDLRREPTELH